MASTKLLYIEDDSKQRESLATSLRERGFEIDTAASGEDGLELLDGEHHELVVCDLNMPGMDGLAVLAKVQARYPDMPFVLLTAHPSIPLAVKAIMEGAQRFLIKPVALDEMEITIYQALEYAKLRRWQRQSEEQLTALVESTPVPYIVTRLIDGKVLYANSHLAELLGLSRDEVKGRSSTEFYYDPAERKQVVERLQKDGFVKDLEVRIRKADGTAIWTMFSLAQAEIGGEKVILGGFVDITRRTELEERLRIYHEVFIHSVDVITVIDKDGHIVDRNPSHERRTGWTDEDVIGKTMFEFLGPEKAAEIKQAIATTGSYRRRSGGRVKKRHHSSHRHLDFPYPRRRGRARSLRGDGSRHHQDQGRAERARGDEPGAA